MISSLINCFLIGVLFADMLERRFPNQFNKFIVETSFNCIYFYSMLQIFLVRINNNLNKLIEGNPTLLKIKNDLDILIKPKEGKLFMNEFIKDGEIIKNIMENPETSIDFTVFSWSNDNSKYLNKKIIYDKNEPKTISEHSDIKFMLIEILIGENKPYKVDLKTDDYNFYLVGNKFTKDFFIYYLINFLNIDKAELNETKFSIKIIDHNVNTFQMDFTDKNESIILRKNDYIAELNNDN